MLLAPKLAEDRPAGTREVASRATRRCADSTRYRWARDLGRAAIMPPVLPAGIQSAGSPRFEPLALNGVAPVSYSRSRLAVVADAQIVAPLAAALDVTLPRGEPQVLEIIVRIGAVVAAILSGCRGIRIRAAVIDAGIASKASRSRRWRRARRLPPRPCSLAGTDIACTSNRWCPRSAGRPTRSQTRMPRGSPETSHARCGAKAAIS